MAALEMDRRTSCPNVSTDNTVKNINGSFILGLAYSNRKLAQQSRQLEKWSQIEMIESSLLLCG
jgi:hypothetical protein